jgi:quercetin dioxygenase-like cupin family protein
MSRFIGLAHLQSMADTARRRRPRSCTIEPGKRLGWHTDATEETQFIIAGNCELYMEDGAKYPAGPGSVFVLPTP